ncbi:Hypothetical predicted protein, partial [Pelobates cultripes]
GYPPELETQHRIKISDMDRKEVLNPIGKMNTTQRIPFISPYKPYSNAIKKIIMKHWNIFEGDINLPNEFRNPPLFSDKRAQNLRDKLVHSDIDWSRAQYDSHAFFTHYTAEKHRFHSFKLVNLNTSYFCFTTVRRDLRIQAGPLKVFSRSRDNIHQFVCTHWDFSLVKLIVKISEQFLRRRYGGIKRLYVPAITASSDFISSKLAFKLLSSAQFLNSNSDLDGSPLLFRHHDTNDFLKLINTLTIGQIMEVWTNFS